MVSMGLRTHCPARQRDCQADIPSLPLAAFCYFCCILSEAILAQLSVNSNEASSEQCSSWTFFDSFAVSICVRRLECLE